MPNTFELIASSTVGAGGAASIDFTSIPSTYTDLVVKLSLRTNRASALDNTFLKINNDATALSQRTILGDGSSASSYVSQPNVANANGNNATASTFANAEVYFPNYAGSTNKSYSSDSVTENNATAAYAELTAGLWSNTAAINRLTFTPGYGTLFLQHSTAYLYGVKNA